MNETSTAAAASQLPRQVPAATLRNPEDARYQVTHDGVTGELYGIRTMLRGNHKGMLELFIGHRSLGSRKVQGQAFYLPQDAMVTITGSPMPLGYYHSL